MVGLPATFVRACHEKNKVGDVQTGRMKSGEEK